jgi:hypothetical protein
MNKWRNRIKLLIIIKKPLWFLMNLQIQSLYYNYATKSKNDPFYILLKLIYINTNPIDIYNFHYNNLLNNV